MHCKDCKTPAYTTDLELAHMHGHIHICISCIHIISLTFMVMHAMKLNHQARLNMIPYFKSQYLNQYMHNQYDALRTEERRLLLLLMHNWSHPCAPVYIIPCSEGIVSTSV